MNHVSIRSSIAALAMTAFAIPVAAQQAKPPVFDVSPYAGYMMFGKLFEGPLGTNISAGSGPVYGAQMSLTMAKNVALYGNVGYSSSDLKVGIPIIGGLDVGTSKALMYDGGVELKVPMQAASVVTPFVQGGVGAMRYEGDQHRVQLRRRCRRAAHPELRAAAHGQGLPRQVRLPGSDVVRSELEDDA
jgi:hypothetical protein